MNLYLVTPAKPKPGEPTQLIVAAGAPDGAILHVGHSTKWHRGWDKATATLLGTATATVPAGIIGRQVA